jgi:hypothetical protein
VIDEVREQNRISLQVHGGGTTAQLLSIKVSYVIASPGRSFRGVAISVTPGPCHREPWTFFPRRGDLSIIVGIASPEKGGYDETA